MSFVSRMENVTDHVPLLQLLANGSSRQRTALLRQANPQLVHCLCECALNVLRGNIPLTPTQKIGLKRYKTQLRYLVDHKQSLKHKKQQLTQRGGGAFIPALLKVVLSML